MRSAVGNAVRGIIDVRIAAPCAPMRWHFPRVSRRASGRVGRQADRRRPAYTLQARRAPVDGCHACEALVRIHAWMIGHIISLQCVK